LIGMDLSRDEMLILSSQPAQALSMRDLVNVIHQMAPSATCSGLRSR
jgi:hypothetical protein